MSLSTNAPNGTLNCVTYVACWSDNRNYRRIAILLECMETVLPEAVRRSTRLTQTTTRFWVR